jgi:hypothetical protein
MDWSKVEKDFDKTLPLRYRVRNKISDVSDFFEGIASLFEISITAVLIIPFLLLSAPFSFLYEILRYFLRKK